jgi:tetratricopeptide (TPR) repeat protein
VRVAVAIGIDKLPLSRAPQYDALEYLLWAQRVAAGDFRWPPHPPHGPAYPYFLGGLLAMSNGSLMFARLAQAALGAATCALVGLTAARWFGARAGIVTTALLAVYAPLVWLDVSIASEGLLLFSLAAALWSAATERHPLLTGALIGLAALTRPTALLFLPLLLWIVPRRRALVAFAAFLVILPVTIANWRASHAFIPVQSFGGMNVYLGNSPLRDGTASARPGGEWEALEAQENLGRRTLREIGQHPAAFARLLLRKTLLTFQNEEIRDTHSFYFFAEQVPLLRWLPGFTILFAFAAAGAATANWRDRGVRAAAVWIVLAAAGCIFLVVGARYRLPIAIGLALFGGMVALKTKRQLAIGAVAAAIAAACTRIVSAPSSHNLAEEWALTSQSLAAERRIDEALAAAQRAIGIDPQNALGWDARGSALAAQGNPEAVAAFRRALAINPKFAAAHERLASVLAQMGDVAGAAEEYRRALAITPRQVSALWALARLDGALGNHAEGLEMARRAAALQRPSDDDWLIIAMLAAELRRFDEAEDALARISAPSPQVEQVREILRRLRGSG